MNGLEAEFKDQVNFYRLDANQPENENIQNKLDLRGHPTIALIDPSGEITNRYFGVQAEDVLFDGLTVLVSNQ
ncbi:MAG: hypothetical protein AAF633_06075 [Chloroflexota bacterium]